MRTFELHRDEDETGVSGTGVVAQGVVFGDGTTVVRWLEAPVDSDNYRRGVRATTVTFPNVEAVEALHGHGGRTRIVWVGSDVPPITCTTCGRGMWPGDNACCPLPKETDR